MLATMQNASNTQHLWGIAAGLGVGFLVVTLVVVYLMRKSFQNRREEQKEEFKTSAPRTENPSAFMAASMQGVIQQLREQEKELERLHRIEKERAEQTERLSEEVTRNMPAGLLVVNATGIISSANPAAEQVLGIRGLGFRRYSEALGEASALTRLVAECLSDGTIFRREEVEHATPSGERRHLGVTISPIRKGQEKINGAICLLSDLTELAALQQQMQLKENLAALGELSAGIAHEFKNALATISGYAQMIQSKPNAADTPENAGKILDQTRSITHVVTEFLRYARPLEISEEPVALRSLLDRIACELKEFQPLVPITVDGDFAEIAGDEGLLRQAFLNLARNAAEAAADHAAMPAVILRGETVRSADENFQRLRVLDNGPGISADVLPKLFRPFFTTKVNGTGLGLAVVQKILLQHGGRVEAQNRSGGGAEFIVTLPATRTISEAVESKEVTI